MGYLEYDSRIKHKRYATGATTRIDLTSDITNFGSLVAVAAFADDALVHYHDGVIGYTSLIGRAFATLPPFFPPFPLPKESVDSGGTTHNLSITPNAIGSDFTVFYYEK